MQEMLPLSSKCVRIKATSNELVDVVQRGNFFPTNLFFFSIYYSMYIKFDLHY